MRVDSRRRNRESSFSFRDTDVRSWQSRRKIGVFFKHFAKISRSNLSGHGVFGPRVSKIVSLDAVRFFLSVAVRKSANHTRLVGRLRGKQKQCILGSKNSVFLVFPKND